MGGFSWKEERVAEYGNTGPASTERPHLTAAQAASQEVADRLGGCAPVTSRATTGSGARERGIYGRSRHRLEPVLGRRGGRATGSRPVT